MSDRLIYAESGTSERIMEPRYLAAKTSRFDPVEIERRRAFMKNQELSMKQESLLFKARRNDFLYLLKNEKKLTPA